MSNNQETVDLRCDFCGKTFARETTLIKHVCETKRRWQDKDKLANRIAYTSWLKFYSKHTGKRKKEYTDFAKSSYYGAFVKFGTYCVDVAVLDSSRYMDWLLDNKIAIDRWNKDSNYSKFLIDFLMSEDPFDSLRRSVETTVKLSEDMGILSKDVLRYGNRNKICYEIVKAKISPWMLYQSESGLKFLEELDETQQKMIIEYIDPEKWAIRFHRYSDIAADIKQILKSGGY